MSKLFKKIARRNPGTDFARRFGVMGSERFTGIRPPVERQPGMSGGYTDIQDPLDQPGRRGRGRGGRAGGNRGGLGPGGGMQQR